MNLQQQTNYEQNENLPSVLILPQKRSRKQRRNSSSQFPTCASRWKQAIKVDLETNISISATNIVHNPLQQASDMKSSKNQVNRPFKASNDVNIYYESGIHSSDFSEHSGCPNDRQRTKSDGDDADNSLTAQKAINISIGENSRDILDTNRDMTKVDCASTESVYSSSQLGEISSKVQSKRKSTKMPSTKEEMISIEPVASLTVASTDITKVQAGSPSSRATKHRRKKKSRTGQKESTPHMSLPAVSLSGKDKLIPNYESLTLVELRNAVKKYGYKVKDRQSMISILENVASVAGKEQSALPLSQPQCVLLRPTSPSISQSSPGIEVQNNQLSNNTEESSLLPTCSDKLYLRRHIQEDISLWERILRYEAVELKDCTEGLARDKRKLMAEYLDENALLCKSTKRD